MKTYSKPETAIEMCLTPEARRRFDAMTAEPSDDFVALVRAAGLDPKTSFRGRVLRIDFGDADLSGFNFSGADLSACDLSRAKLDAADMTGVRRGSGQRFLEVVKVGPSVRSVAFSPDGSWIVSAGMNGILSIWDSTSGAELGKLMRGHDGAVNCVAFSPDCSRIVSGGADSTLRLWDTHLWKQLGEPMRGHEGEIRSVAFSPDGNRVVSSGVDRTLRLWDVVTGLQLSESMGGHQSLVTSVAFTPDGSYVFSSGWDDQVRKWDGYTGEDLGVLKECVSREKGDNSDGVNDFAISPDNCFAVFAHDNSNLYIYETTPSFSLRATLYGHNFRVTSTSISHNGSKIVSGGSDKTVRIWDAKKGTSLNKELKHHKSTVNSVEFSPDGSRIVSGGEDGKVIVWFLDPPVHEVFVTTRPEEQAYTRTLLAKLFAHPEMIKRNVVEATLDPLTHPRPDEGARYALEHSVAALFIVGDKGLTFMQHGELELARRLQRKTGQSRIIPVFTKSAIPTEPPNVLKGYHFVHMPLDKPEAFNALVEAICQAVDNPASALKDEQESEGTQTERDAPTTEAAYPTVKTQSRVARKQRIQINRDG